MLDHEKTETGNGPLIDEVRAVRRALSQQFGDDVDRLCVFLAQEQEKHRPRLRRATEAGRPRGLPD